MRLEWMATSLNTGTKTHLSHLIHWHKRNQIDDALLRTLNRLKALSDFYKSYRGRHYWKDFQAELSAMVQKNGTLNPALFQ